MEGLCARQVNNRASAYDREEMSLSDDLENQQQSKSQMGHFRMPQAFQSADDEEVKVEEPAAETESKTFGCPSNSALIPNAQTEVKKPAGFSPEVSEVQQPKREIKFENKKEIQTLSNPHSISEHLSI